MINMKREELVYLGAMLMRSLRDSNIALCHSIAEDMYDEVFKDKEGNTMITE